MKTNEWIKMQKSDRIWSWVIGSQPRLYTLNKINYPRQELEPIGFGVIQIGDLLYTAFKYEVTPEILNLYAILKSVVNTLKGDVKFYTTLPEDHKTSLVGNRTFYWWAVNPMGEVLDVCLVCVYDTEDRIRWCNQVIQNFVHN
jgi:hypothetical protein